MANVIILGIVRITEMSNTQSLLLPVLNCTGNCKQDCQSCVKVTWDSLLLKFKFELGSPFDMTTSKFCTSVLQEARLCQLSRREH